MNTRFEAKWLVGILTIFLILGLIHTVAAMEFGLGDIPLDKAAYREYLKILTVRPLPGNYDARDDDIVTPPKDQGRCGSCWAFACVGAFESHLLKKFTIRKLIGTSIDLSEQQQVSCNDNMSGCCGGSMTAIRWWQNDGPVREACFSYEDFNTSCPTTTTVQCSSSEKCWQLPYRVTNYHTIGTEDFTQVKTSLYNDGPSYFRYDVYDDFHDFWGSGNPGDVYVNKAGTSRLGGHAVLVIGWDDDKDAYLLKNSWGATGGPNGDGTFWMAYEGHANDLGFGMANFNLVRQRIGGKAAPSITGRSTVANTWGNIRRD